MSFGGPISDRPRKLPKRVPGEPASAGWLGLNLLPIVQLSSVSAGVDDSWGLKPEVRRL